MSDNKRVDLSKEFGGIGSDLLKDIEAAANQVKKRKADDKAKEAREAKRKESTKISAVAIAAATVALFVIAYFVVFGMPGNNPQAVTEASSQPVQPTKVVTPTASSTTGNNAPKALPTQPPLQTTAPRPARSAQPQGYDQPSDPGM